MIPSSANGFEIVAVLIGALGFTLQTMLLSRSIDLRQRLIENKMDGGLMIIARRDIRNERLRIFKLLVCLAIGIAGVFVPQPIHVENILFETSLMVGLDVVEMLIVVGAICDYRDKIRLVGHFKKPDMLEKLVTGGLISHPLRRRTDEVD